MERIQQLAEFYNVQPDYFLSEELPVINYNTGNYSRAIIGTTNYHEKPEITFELYERILKEKDIQISYLIQQLDLLKKEKEGLYDLINKFTKQNH